MGKNKETIFIQIASYRDPELVPTLTNLLENAKYPERLHICIAFQYSEEDTFTKDIEIFSEDENITILRIPYKEAVSACWARNKIQQEYKGETYTLQLDSHHRFIANWDEECVKMLKGLQKKGYKKPLLTSYVPAYQPDKDPEGRALEPWGMNFDRFTPEGVVFFLPYHITEDIKEPIPARFFSAHFAFTLGKHCEEVPHDPQFYFHGEEITLAVRSFTHGYDLFHPNKIIAYHEYTRNGRTKQWDDDPTWVNKNNVTHARVRQLLGVDAEVCTPCNKNSFKKFGLGEVRTLKDYETYAGIRFSDRAITERCSTNQFPPGQKEDVFIPKFKHFLHIDKTVFKKDDYTFAAVICKDKDNNETYRKDWDYFNELLKGEKVELLIDANIEKPHKVMVWGYSKKDEWSEIQDFFL